ncbi:MAG: CARDB domain-containing protein [Balneolaceae bacterium]|nr:CARDB domain-containing protein [Balneolaceae bacterium]
MDFVFQGFQSALPVWFYLLLAVATLTIAWWSYKDIRSINPAFRYSLIALRGITYLILIALLINPLFRSESTRYENPNVLVMFDNSASLSVNKGEYKGAETYEETISTLNFPAINRLDFRYFMFGNEVSPGHPDSLTLDGSATNIFNAAEIIRNNERDAKAAVLFSDGIFNQGQNPLFLSRELNIPVFTVALGDTSRLQDLVVQNVVSNSTGYLNTSHPVEVNILNQGFAGESFQVQLISDGEVLQSQTITPNASVSTHTVSFQLQLNEEGLQQYEISIPEKEGEWTDANNAQPFSIEVLDDRQRILSLAFEIHPDVRLVRSLLLQDENTQLSTRTWLGGNRFINGSLSVDPDTLDLVVLQGYPSQGVPSQLSEPDFFHIRKCALHHYSNTPFTVEQSAGLKFNSSYIKFSKPGGGIGKPGASGRVD